MNRLLVVLTLFGTLVLGSLTILVAEDPTSLTVTPSDQIHYPDAKDILNPSTTTVKTNSKVQTAANVPGGPLLASTPVPVRAAAAPATTATSAHGWFLVWTLQGDEASVKAWWAAQTGFSAAAAPIWNALKNGQWEVQLGPLDADSLANALKTQGGAARLVRK